MRLCILFLMICIDGLLCAQHVSDNFTDDNLSSAPAWLGDTASFLVNSQNQLQLNADAMSSDKFVAIESSSFDSVTWRVGLKMLFNPSSANFVRIWLMADNIVVDSITEGVFIEAGGAKDNIRLYLLKDDNTQLLLSGAEGRLDFSSVELMLRVFRSDVGEWQVWSQVNNETEFITEGKVVEPVVIANKYFGLQCVYTSSRADKFVFDDVSVIGLPFVDLTLPQVTEVVVRDQYRIEVTFSEPINILGQSLPLLIDGVKRQGVSIVLSARKHLFVLDEALPLERLFDVVIEGVQDYSGNMLSHYNQSFYYTPFYVKELSMLSSNRLRLVTSVPLNATSILDVIVGGNREACEVIVDDTLVYIQVLSIVNDISVDLFFPLLISERADSISFLSTPLFWHRPQVSDIIFSEVMCDPSPTVQLPEAEYFELYNNSNYSIFLDDLLVQMGSRIVSLPSVEMQPGAYQLFCSTVSLPLLSDFGAIGLSLFGLINGNGELLLWCDSTIICETHYKSAWHTGSFKADGGWSLECVDVSNPEEEKNWRSSLSSFGGTPGSANSQSDFVSNAALPNIVNIYAYDSDSVGVWFSELVSISGRDNSSLQIDGLKVNFSASTNLTNYVVITGLDLKDGEVYSLSVEGFEDRCGDEMLPFVSVFALPTEAQKGSVVINEVMFHPSDSVAEYIEIYNQTAATIDLSNLLLCKPTLSDYPGKAIDLSDMPRSIAADEYMVFTADAIHFRTDYGLSDESCVIECKSFPLLNNDEGQLVLVTKSGIVIDSVAYNAKWHFDLLNNDAGVSLERLSPNIDGQSATNWHSAASSVNFSSPAMPNSQRLVTPATEALFTVLPKVFTPDNDGTDDVAIVQLLHQANGTMASISVMNSGGIVVRHLVSNYLMGNMNSVTWDGRDDDGLRMPTGLYLVFINYWMVGKQSKIEKCAVVISPKG